MRLAVLIVALLSASRAYAQGGPDHFALGVAAYEARKPEEALKHFQAILAVNPKHYQANCRAALAAIDIVRQRPNEEEDPDGYYKLANVYARRAVDLDWNNPEGHFLVALTIRYMAPHDRVNKGDEVWFYVKQALELDPKHHGAYHLLGRWHADLSRIVTSSLDQLLVGAVIGDIADSVSWDAAVKNMEKAVELAPSIIQYRLSLAETYRAVKRTEDARSQLVKIDSLPIVGVRDSIYKVEAKRMLAELDKTAQKST